jgi:hypothetical protein
VQPSPLVLREYFARCRHYKNCSPMTGMAEWGDSALPTPARDPFTIDLVQRFLNYIRDSSRLGVKFDASAPHLYQQRTYCPRRALRHYFDCTDSEGVKRVEELVAAATQRSDRRPHYNTVARYCSRVFTILISIGQAHHIGHFVQQPKLYDSALPFRRQDASLFPRVEGNETFFDQFYHIQWQFCVTRLDARLENVNLDDDQILPLTLLDRLHKTQGSGAAVHKVEVHEDFDGLGGSAARHHVSDSNPASSIPTESDRSHASTL